MVGHLVEGPGKIGELVISSEGVRNVSSPSRKCSAPVFREDTAGTRSRVTANATPVPIKRVTRKIPLMRLKSFASIRVDVAIASSTASDSASSTAGKSSSNSRRAKGSATVMR
jgi:hypothetical protein